MTQALQSHSSLLIVTQCKTTQPSYPLSQPIEGGREGGREGAREGSGADLLVENHVDSVRLDVHRVLPHELQDVLDGGRVGQAAQAHAVPRVGRGQEGGRGHNWQNGRRRQR